METFLPVIDFAIDAFKIIVDFLTTKLSDITAFHLLLIILTAVLFN